jgi:hypothetical protein
MREDGRAAYPLQSKPRVHSYHTFRHTFGTASQCPRRESEGRAGDASSCHVEGNHRTCSFCRDRVEKTSVSKELQARMAQQEPTRNGYCYHGRSSCLSPRNFPVCAVRKNGCFQTRGYKRLRFLRTCKWWPGTESNRLQALKTHKLLILQRPKKPKTPQKPVWKYIGGTRKMLHVSPLQLVTG